MSKVLDSAVTRADDDSWTFQCPGIADDPCGPFVSTGWPTKTVAQARGQQHLDEHELGREIGAAVQAATDEALAAAQAKTSDPDSVDRDAVAASVDRAAVRDEAIGKSAHAVMPELEEFRTEHGLISDVDGLRALKASTDRLNAATGRLNAATGRGDQS